jgi:hypothetical protein
MEQAEFMEGIVDAPPESQPAFGVLVAQSILHVTEARDPGRWEWQEPWTVIHQELHLMPPFHRNPLLRQRNLSENVSQALQSMGWQGDCCHGSNPRMVLHIDQLALPWSIFLTEEGSLQKMLSPVSTGQKT